jgi:hypothetical protein
MIYTVQEVHNKACYLARLLDFNYSPLIYHSHYRNLCYITLIDIAYKDYYR